MEAENRDLRDGEGNNKTRRLRRGRDPSTPLRSAQDDTRGRTIGGAPATKRRLTPPSSALRREDSPLGRGIGGCQRPLCGARKMHLAYACPPCRIAIPGPASRRPANGAAAEIAALLLLPPAAQDRNSPPWCRFLWYLSFGQAKERYTPVSLKGQDPSTRHSGSRSNLRSDLGIAPYAEKQALRPPAGVTRRVTAPRARGRLGAGG